MNYNFKRKTKTKRYMQGQYVIKDGRQVWEYWFVYERKAPKKQKAKAQVQENYSYAYPYPND